MNSHDHLGTVSIIDVPDAANSPNTPAGQRQQSPRLQPGRPGKTAARRQAGAGAAAARRAVGLQARHLRHQGEPHLRSGVRRHEGRQRRSQPVHLRRGDHAQSSQARREFTLFDNFYCSGVLSADGHHGSTRRMSPIIWKTPSAASRAAIRTRAAIRSPSPSTGFLWDNALAHKKTFRNYGEFVKPRSSRRAPRWNDMYDDYKNGTRR